MESQDLRGRREELVVRMLEARTEDEAEAAEEAAGRWLAEHPGDLAVAAAGERLAARRELREDPEARGWRGFGVFFAVCVVPLTVVIEFFGGWDVAWWVGPFLAVMAASLCCSVLEEVRRRQSPRAKPETPWWWGARS